MLRFVVVGPGKAGAAFAEGISAHPHAALVAVAGGTDARGRALARRHGTRQVRGANEATSLNADIAVVSTPHHLHENQVVQLLESGKHVIVEKPAALTSAGLRRIAGTASAVGRRVFVGFVQRCSPGAVAVREHVKSRQGELLGVAATQWLFRDLNYYQGWKGDPEAAGGGCLVNQAIHAVDLALAVTGIEPTSIRCRTRTLRAIHVEDSVTASLEDDSGRFIDLAAATCTPLIEPQLLRLFFPETTVLLLGTETPHAAVVRTPKQASEAQTALAALPDDYGDGHARLVDDVVTALHEEAPSRYGCELRDTLTTHEALFAMYNSAHSDGAAVSSGGVT